MLVFDDEDGPRARSPRDLHGRLERLGVYERERRPWLPHVTVVRFRRAAAASPAAARPRRTSLRPARLFTIPVLRPGRGAVRRPRIACANERAGG